MSFRAPVSEQRIMLHHIAKLGEIAAHERFAAVTQETVDAILEGVASFAQAEWAPIAQRGDREGAAITATGVSLPRGYRAAYQAYVEAGWGTLGVDEAWGGQGFPVCVQLAALESLGAANLGLALAPMLTSGTIEALSKHGSSDQQAAFLSKLATGEWTGTMSLTEPQAGSDVGALRTLATPRNNGKWSIKGTKIFISYGDHDLTDNIVHLVLARTPGAPGGTKGLSLFIVPKYRLAGNEEAGERNDIRVVAIEHKLGLHVSPTCVLSFGDDGDCIGELVGELCGGMRAMFTMMNHTRLNTGLQGVEVAEAATQQACEYARTRTQGRRGGQSAAIIEHPDVRRMLMRMKAQTLAARALVYYTAGQLDRSNLGSDAARDRLELLTPLAKAHATDLGNEVAYLGVQVHGGMGYVEETGAARHMRDARVLPIYEGTNGIQAADFVMRKLAMKGGAVIADLIAEMRSDMLGCPSASLVDSLERVVAHLAAGGEDDRLAASYPVMTLASVTISTWLLERLRQTKRIDSELKAVADFYVRQIAPEALGLSPSAMALAGELYVLPASAF